MPIEFTSQILNEETSLMINNYGPGNKQMLNKACYNINSKEYTLKIM